MDVPVKNVGRPDQIHQNSSYSSTKTLILDLQDAKNRGPLVQKKSFQLPSARLAPGGWQRGGFQFPLTHGILEGTAGGIPRPQHHRHILMGHKNGITGDTLW